MELDSKKVVERVKYWRKDEGKSCSQGTLMGIGEVAGLDLEELELLASGFSGGIGATFEDGTCGGLTGAVMALGLLGKDNAMIKSMSKDLFNAFKAEYGAVTCGEISDKGKDKSPCVELCLFSDYDVWKYHIFLKLFNNDYIIVFIKYNIRR